MLQPRRYGLGAVRRNHSRQASMSMGAFLDGGLSELQGGFGPTADGHARDWVIRYRTVIAGYARLVCSEGNDLTSQAATG
jgi:hypothetical protein